MKPMTMLSSRWSVDCESVVEEKTLRTQFVTAGGFRVKDPGLAVESEIDRRRLVGVARVRVDADSVRLVAGVACAGRAGVAARPGRECDAERARPARYCAAVASAFFAGCRVELEK